MSETQNGEAHKQAQTQGGNPPDATRNSVLEWVVATFGFVGVLGAVGFLVFQALTTEDRPPEIELRVVSIQDVRGGYLALIEARNDGDEAAAELGVEGAVERSGRSLETSETTFDFVPADSVREGGLFFTKNPRGALTLRALGYREP